MLMGLSPAGPACSSAAIRITPRRSGSMALIRWMMAKISRPKRLSPAMDR